LEIKMKSMKAQQSGFTLVEIAIVLVIIGLLLGGILKGQELINSAKVKNLAQDFRTVQTALYGYQDRFKALPGDHATAATVVTGATNATGGTLGNAVIEGAWNSATATATLESELFWQHARLAGFLPGPTAANDAEYYPKNVDGGRLGISSATGAQLQIATMQGSYQICSAGILGRFAKQLDIQLDDGNTQTGSVRATEYAGAVPALGTAATATGTINDAASTVVCMTF
jgi:prepilin-type N-terminal cleavage/methylation domain-containing protein